MVDIFKPVLINALVGIQPQFKQIHQVRQLLLLRFRAQLGYADRRNITSGPDPTTITSYFVGIFLMFYFQISYAKIGLLGREKNLNEMIDGRNEM